MEETIYITFDEPLFFFFENEWINTLKLDIFLRINPSIPSSKKDPILSLISKKTSTIEKRFLIITHEYEFHYYSKSKFKKKEFLSNDLSDIAPNHIIQLSERYKDEIGEECELSNFFGCNGMSPNSKEKICLAMANLYHRARYSKSSLINQIQERMKMMVCLCLDELIKNIYNFVTEYSNEFKFSSIEIIEKLLNNEFRIDFDEQNEELRKVIENTVYKTIIANGLFPLYCEINTMNTFVLKQLFSSIFIPDSILPWSSRFHASFSIGSYYYSFNESNRVITKYFKNRALKEEFFYVRIRILDFFPLDDWVYLISDFFIKNLENILDEMVEMLNDANFGKELGESYIKNREEEGKKNSNPPENENTTKNINEPLLCPKIKKGFFKLLEKITEKNVNDKTNIREKFKCLEDMENFLDEFNFLKKRKEVIDICGKIAIEFFENYKFELVNSEILMNICKIIARTEIKQYELLSNNCQTPVAESLHIIHEKMKQFIEPLQELTIEKEEKREIFHKFSCSLDESLPNKSMVLDCNLDYFGIYTDKSLQEYLKKIKKISSFAEIKKVNQEMARFIKDSNIQALFTNFQEQTCKNLKNKLKTNMMEDLPQLNKSICYFSFIWQNYLFNATKNIACAKEKLKTEKVIEKFKIYQDFLIEKNKMSKIYNQLIYIYYNSIRLKNSFKLNKNNISYIGFLVVKDPENLFLDLPENRHESVFASLD